MSTPIDRSPPASTTDSYTYTVQITTRIDSVIKPKSLAAYITDAVLNYGATHYITHPSNRVARDITGITTTHINKLGYKSHTASSE